MIDSKTVYNRALPVPSAQKRDFSIQMAIAVAPSVTDFFLRTAEKLVKRRLAQNPGIDPQALFDYQSEITARVKKEIHKHTVEIAESFHGDYFNDKKEDFSKAQY
jgi:hypothetical protein